MTALRQVSRVLHGQWSRIDSAAQNIYARRDADSCDLQLKVKGASSSTITGSKAQGHVMSVGRHGDDFEQRNVSVDFPPHTVTALDVYKVNTLSASSSSSSSSLTKILQQITRKLLMSQFPDKFTGILPHPLNNEYVISLIS